MRYLLYEMRMQQACIEANKPFQRHPTQNLFKTLIIPFPLLHILSWFFNLRNRKAHDPSFLKTMCLHYDDFLCHRRQ
jgi:hypothetical protein